MWILFLSLFLTGFLDRACFGRWPPFHSKVLLVVKTAVGQYCVCLARCICHEINEVLYYQFCWATRFRGIAGALVCWMAAVGCPRLSGALELRLVKSCGWLQIDSVQVIPFGHVLLLVLVAQCWDWCLILRIFVCETAQP
ncbi:hypothetical protein U1Q18_005610 [Sarracenia purpurea var. burkii]